MRTTQVTAEELANIRKVERRRCGQEIIARLMEAEWLADDEATRDAIIATVDDVAEGRAVPGLMGIVASDGDLPASSDTIEKLFASEHASDLHEFEEELGVSEGGLPRDGPTVEGDEEYADILRRQGIR